MLLYLEQEGRGCGIINKAKAYALKDSTGLDTVEAYRQLGLEIDGRHYDGAALALKSIGLRHIRLLTSNPAKAAELTDAGIIVKRIGLRTKPTKFNIDYLLVKQFKLGHDLGLDASTKRK